jgi:hypothetical protein
MNFFVCFHQIVVEVVLGEQRGEGVRMGTRCLWDADTDNFASGYNFIENCTEKLYHFTVHNTLCLVKNGLAFWNNDLENVRPYQTSS